MLKKLMCTLLKLQFEILTHLHKGCRKNIKSFSLPSVAQPQYNDHDQEIDVNTISLSP